MNSKKNKIGDVLSWSEFFENTSNEKSYPPKKIKLYNRLVASTKNFFAIAAIGAFVPGYLMLISKEMIPSFSLIKDEYTDELKWFIKSIQQVIEKTYNRKVISFEHGMCACVGGLDRAHLHFMTVSQNVSDEVIKKSINKALLNRKAGISAVEINGHKLENIHDITTIMDAKSNGEKYKVHGKQLLYEDINNNLDKDNWPFSARNHVNKGGHYVFFNTNSNYSSFFTDKNFQTQLGREIVYEVELQTNPEFQKLVKKITDKNIYASVWKWQNFSFEENILKTMHDLIPQFKKIKSNTNSDKFSFNFFGKK